MVMTLSYRVALERHDEIWLYSAALQSAEYGKAFVMTIQTESGSRADDADSYIGAVTNCVDLCYKIVSDSSEVDRLMSE